MFMAQILLISNWMFDVCSEEQITVKWTKSQRDRRISNVLCEQCGVKLMLRHLADEIVALIAHKQAHTHTHCHTFTRTTNATDSCQV